jgi:signal peptidase I
VAVIVVAFLLVAPIARQLFAQVGPQEKAVDTTGAGRGGRPASSEPATPVPSEAAPAAPRSSKGGKNTTVNLDGRGVPIGAMPTILLNPGLVRPGTKVAISGFGFDPGALVEVTLVGKGSKAGPAVASGKVDKNGSFTTMFTVPDNVRSTSPTVVASQRNSDKTASAQAVVPAGVGTMKVGRQVGKPGDRVTLTANGFIPGEPVKVYWGALTGQAAATLQADQGGGIGQVSVRVPVAAVGNSTLALVGDKSQTVATSPFTVLSLYPTIRVAPYAVRAANRIGFAARGFGPDERVLVYVNSTSGAPVMTVQADSNGGFSGVGFTVPFGLKRQQSIILIGELSRAVVSSGFIVLPYTPTAQPSTYGGAPGTSLTFYANGFAANEVVLVYKRRTHDSAGELVGGFRADGKGRAAAAGQYMIAGDPPGKLTFALVGRQSGGVATAAIQVQHSDVPVQLAPQPKYTLPPELQDRPSPKPTARASQGAASPSATGGPAAGPTANPATAPPAPTK